VGVTALVAAVVGAVAGMAAAAWALRAWEIRRATRLLDRWRGDETDRLVAASVRHSRAVLRGQITEQVTPLLAGFAWDPADARFLGKPVDYVVFDGYSEVRAGAADRLRQIVFVDVKTGRAGLSRTERRVKACVERGDVHGLILATPPPPATRPGELHGRRAP
jgi:predicted Holliday junction resolvase-like endonuclease